MRYLQQLEDARRAEARRADEVLRQAELAATATAIAAATATAAATTATATVAATAVASVRKVKVAARASHGSGSGKGGGQGSRSDGHGSSVDSHGSNASSASNGKQRKRKDEAAEEGDEQGGRGEAPMVAPVAEAGALLLFLCNKSSTGYLKVSIEASDHKKTAAFRAFRIAHPKQGCFLGRFQTAVEAAMHVARDVRQRGIPRRVLQAALDKGLKGQELIDAVEAARVKAAAKAKARGKARAQGDDEGDDDDDDD
jgi:GNAT superfamily N-acetyltransferase